MKGLPIYISQLDKVVDLMYYYLKNWDRDARFDIIIIKIEIPLISIDEEINAKMKIALDALNEGLRRKNLAANKTHRPIHHLRHRTMTILLSNILLVEAGFKLHRINNIVNVRKQRAMRQKLKEFITLQWDEEIQRIQNILEQVPDITKSRPKNQFEDIPDYEWDLDSIYGQGFVIDDIHNEFSTMNVYFIKNTPLARSDGFLT